VHGTARIVSRDDGVKLGHTIVVGSLDTAEGRGVETTLAAGGDAIQEQMLAIVPLGPYALARYHRRLRIS
jgi:hypothetical protein